MKQLTYQFINQSSTHGLGSIYLSRGVLKKVGWLLFIFTASIGLCLNLTIQIKKFLSDPILVEIKILHSNDIEFPAVTFCNINPIKESPTFLVSTKKNKKRSLENLNIGCCCTCCMNNKSTNYLQNCNLCSNSYVDNLEICPKKEKLKETSFNPTSTYEPTTIYHSTTTKTPIQKEEYLNAEILTEFVASLNKDEKRKYGYTMNDLVLNCTYAGSNCDPKFFKQINNPIHGNCYLFNSGWNNIDKLVSHRTGRRYGLILSLNINQQDFSIDSGDTAAIRLHIHSGDQMSFPEDQGLLISPGYSTSISLQKIIIQRLNRDYSACLKFDDPQVNQFPNVYNEMFPETKYSQEACLRTCYQKNVLSNCQCADAYYPFIGKTFEFKEALVCTVKNITQENCRKAVKRNFNKGLLSCECPIVCNEVAYNSAISIGKWPSSIELNSTLKYLETKVSYDLRENNDYTKNLINLEIFFEEFNYQIISEIPSYEAPQLFSDIGGILGLYLGMSFMSIVEIYDYFMHIIYFFFKNKISRKNDKRTKKEKIKRKADNPMFLKAQMENESIRDILLKF